MVFLLSLIAAAAVACVHAADSDVCVFFPFSERERELIAPCLDYAGAVSDLQSQCDWWLTEIRPHVPDLVRTDRSRKRIVSADHCCEF